MSRHKHRHAAPASPAVTHAKSAVIDKSGSVTADGHTLAWHVRTARYIAKVARESSLEIISDALVKLVSLISVSYLARLLEEYLTGRHGGLH